MNTNNDININTNINIIYVQQQYHHQNWNLLQPSPVLAMEISSKGLRVVFLDQKEPTFYETSSRIGWVFPPCAFAGKKSVEKELWILGISPFTFMLDSDVYTYAVKNLTLEIKTLETTVFL